MRNLLLIVACLLSLSCERRPLTYAYISTVDIVVRTDWSALSEEPNGMSIYCYPDDGGAPIVKLSNNTEEAIISLPVGTYKLLVFNESVSDYSSISFSGMDNYETAEVYASTTTSKWAESKAESELVNNPAELAASTYHSVTVTQEDVNEVIRFKEKNETVEIEPNIYIDLTPKSVVKRTKVRVRVDGIHNLLSTRATLLGMATGYHFSSQASHEAYATHLLESWAKTVYDTDETQGEITITFTCFGLPETTTATRAFDMATWGGMLYIDALLVDNSTIESFEFELAHRTITADDYYEDDNEESSKGDDDDADTDIDTDVDVDVDVDVDIDIAIGFSLNDEEDDGVTLQDVESDSSSEEGGFNATVEDWGDEEYIPL